MMAGGVTADPHEQVDAVVGVRDESLREARIGLVWSLALVLLLLAIHTSWKIFATFVALEVLGGTYAVVREILRFREHLDDAEPLPNEAVEATRRPRQSSTPRHILLVVGVVAAAVGGLDALEVADWAPRLIAASIAAAIAQAFVRPLAEMYLVSRWERAHGHARLFRRVGTTDKDHRQELYVADRPVPAA